MYALFWVYNSHSFHLKTLSKNRKDYEKSLAHIINASSLSIFYKGVSVQETVLIKTHPN